MTRSLAALLSVLLTGLPAYSQEVTPQTPYELHFKTDLFIFGVAVNGWPVPLEAS